MQQTKWTYVAATPSTIVRQAGCTVGGFSEFGAAPVDRLEIPVASAVIILCCGGPLAVTPALTDGGTARLDAFYAGLQSSAQCVTHGGINECVEIRLSPATAHTLLGGMATESNQGVLDLHEIPGRPFEKLVDHLRGTRSWEARLTAVDRFLARNMVLPCRGTQPPPRNRVPPELVYAWHALERTRGQLSVSALAGSVGWSERHLIVRFRAFFGVNPKAAARRLRFAHAWDLMAAGGPAAGLGMIAATAGYSDQSHMTREFRDYAGVTPALLRDARFDDLPGIPASVLCDRSADDGRRSVFF